MKVAVYCCLCSAKHEHEFDLPNAALSAPSFHTYINNAFPNVNKVMHIYLRVLTFVESSIIEYGMMMPRLKKPVSYALDPKLLIRLDKWIEKQELPPKKTAVIEAALTDWLDKKEKK